MKSKPLFITNTFPLDNNLNYGKFNYNAAFQLNSHCELTIVHLRSWKPWRSVVQQKKIGDLEVNVFSFPYYPTLIDSIDAFQLWIYKFFFYILLGKKLDKYNVIHSVGAGFAAIVGSYLSKRKNVPHIAQCIGTDVNYKLPKIKNSFGVRGMEKFVNYFTCNSIELENQVKKLFPKSNTKTIYRGVDLNYFTSDDSLIELKNNKEIVFTYLGGLSLRKETGKGRDYKGGETLLKAWVSVKKTGNLKLNFAGPEVTTFLVDKIINGDHQDYNINVFSLLSKEQVRDLLIESDIVIIPSWAEGLPNVGMEAIASSCAIIGSNVGGIPEIINNNGYLFSPGDRKELVRLIEMISSDMDSLNKMKLQSRKIAEDKFDSKQFVTQYIQLYENL